MPQLNPEFFISQLFWLFVTFSFLLVFLWRISLPRISTVLNKREKKINEDIAEAKELQAEAEKIQQSIEDQLKKAHQETSDMLKTSSTSFQEKTTNELSKIDEALDSKINESANLIEQNKNESLSKIHENIKDITKITLSKIAQFDVSDNDISNAVKSAKRKIN